MIGVSRSKKLSKEPMLKEKKKEMLVHKKSFFTGSKE